MSAPVVLRRLRWWDVPRLLDVERGAFGPDAWSEPGFWSELAWWPESRYYVVAEEPEGELVGYAGLLSAADEATVQTVVVDPDKRGRGVGRRLLDDLLAEAVRRGAGTVWLEVREDNAPALALYDAYGFERAGVRRGYYEGGRVDAVVMRRRPVSGRRRWQAQA
ncbi:MAG: ribosomal protein S18-alanine N-acetyltransferase [Actinomycetes bacterium]